jgi:hypothetical protein
LVTAGAASVVSYLNLPRAKSLTKDAAQPLTAAQRPDAALAADKKKGGPETAFFS